jgi:S1-C subfamily serine protease
MLRRSAAFLVVLALTVFAFGLGTAVQSSQAARGVRFIEQAQQAAPDTSQLTPLEQTYAGIYQRVSPAVVAIYVEVERRGEVGFGQGSGFVVDTDGHIVTNFHVVDGAENIEVNFVDGTIVRGEVVGLDPDSDIAVIKVDLPVERLSPVVLGDSDTLVIGQMTLALGSPFGQRWTMTSGIVSAIDRSIQGLGNYSIGGVIQTDAAINPGNSGGPLFNLDGEVIGVNSQISTETGTSSGIGYAVPINLVRRVMNELIASGEVNYSYLGITSPPGGMTLAYIEAYDLPNNQRGVIVDTVVPDGPADEAGLQGSDRNTIEIITAVNGEAMQSFDTLIAYLAENTRPGDVVTLTVWRDGVEEQLQLELGSRPR